MEETSQFGRSVRLFLVDGTAAGLVVAEIPNWTGKVLAAPRSRLTELVKRKETSRTGIYVLTGPDPERASGQLAYIGEADDVANRLRIHLRSEDKDFFHRVAIIIGADDNLTKAHVRYLESGLIRLARRSEGVTLVNGTEPDFQLLPEADRADMQYFLGQLKLLLPIVGIDLFRKLPEPGPTANGDVFFNFVTAGVSARAKETDEGFVVLAGSSARMTPTETFPRGYKTLRDQLITDGKLAPGPDAKHLLFVMDTLFSSPTAAASIVAARSESGPREWLVEGSGDSYRDWQAANLSQSES
jgi:hypothetical protein